MPSLLDSLESLETSCNMQDSDRKDADSRARGREVDTEKSQSADGSDINHLLVMAVKTYPGTSSLHWSLP